MSDKSKGENRAFALEGKAVLPTLPADELDHVVGGSEVDQRIAWLGLRWYRRWQSAAGSDGPHI